MRTGSRLVGSERELRERLDARRGELEQAALARIAAIADPSSAPDPAYVAGLRAALAAGLDYGLAAVAAPGREPDPVPVELLGQARLAARNAVSLEAVLRRYSAGHTLLADALLEEAAALGLGAVELKSALRALAARYERIIAAVSEEYERETALLPGGADRRRNALVGRLLAGEPLHAAELNYSLEARHLALVAFGQDAACALEGLGARTDRRLLLIEPDMHTAWAWLGGRRPFECEELELLASQPWPEGCALACGEPGEGLPGWRLTHRQAAAALPVARLDERAFVFYSDVALLAAVLRDDLLAASLRHAYLEPLRSERDCGEAAKATLRAYFGAARNVSSAAAALGINRRTRAKPEPVALNVQGKVAEADGSHPPALTEVVVDTDKNGTIDVRGAPTCKQGQLEARTTVEAEKVCGPAILGTGTTDVEVLFAESKPVALHSKLLALNGGTSGGVTTIYIHAFLTSPVTTALVTTVKIKKERKGPYGIRSVATIPKIAGYSGSVTAFDLTFKKKLFSYNGRKHGYLSAKCTNGKFLAQAEAKFHDGTKVGPAKISRACTPKG